MARGSIERLTGVRGTSYKVRYDAPPDPRTGRRSQRSKTFRVRKDAEAFLTRTRNDLLDGSYVGVMNITVADLCQRYMDALKGNIAPSTRLMREGMIRVHIVPALGPVRAQALDPLAVQAMVDDLSRTKRAGTVRNVHRLLSMAYAQAIRWRIVADNPCAGVVLPKADTKRGALAWTADEAATFLRAAAAEPFFPIYRLILLTGLRRSEALALRWRDVDLANGRLLVRGSLVRQLDLTFLPGPTKTPGSVRSVALDAATVDWLASERTIATERNRFAGGGIEGTFLFPDRKGEPICPDRVTQRFTRLVAGIADEDGEPLPAITVHGLRHTHATLLAQSGVDLRTIMDRLGHATPTMTLGRYMHGSVESDRKAAAALASLLVGEPDTNQEGEVRSDLAR